MYLQDIETTINRIAEHNDINYLCALQFNK